MMIDARGGEEITASGDAGCCAGGMGLGVTTVWAPRSAAPQALPKLPEASSRQLTSCQKFPHGRVGCDIMPPVTLTLIESKNWDEVVHAQLLPGGVRASICRARFASIRCRPVKRRGQRRSAVRLLPPGRAELVDGRRLCGIGRRCDGSVGEPGGADHPGQTGSVCRGSVLGFQQLRGEHGARWHAHGHRRRYDPRGRQRRPRLVHRRPVVFLIRVAAQQMDAGFLRTQRLEFPRRGRVWWRVSRRQ